jgi:23S rRNA pseudouridine2605 synthase
MAKHSSPRNLKSGSSREQAHDNTVRLNKFLSECGIAARRKADELIAEGAVIINGKKVYELGTRVNPETDRITVNGKPVKAPAHKVYILFHKPKGIVTTMEDPEGRPTIADFFTRLPVRVFPVGRLDFDTEGMILLTNDGDFAQKVMHPREEILKTYLVKIDGQPGEDQLNRLRTGVSIIGGRVSAKGVERIRRGDSDKYDWIKLMIAEGKNRQIRQMFEKIGFDVMKLQRVAIGRLRMPTSLQRGEYLFLTEAGVAKIFQRDPLDSKGRPIKPQGKAGHSRNQKRQRSVKTEARDAASRSPNRVGKTGSKK